MRCQCCRNAFVELAEARKCLSDRLSVYGKTLSRAGLDTRLASVRMSGISAFATLGSHMATDRNRRISQFTQTLCELLAEIQNVKSPLPANVRDALQPALEQMEVAMDAFRPDTTLFTCREATP